MIVHPPIQLREMDTIIRSVTAWSCFTFKSIIYVLVMILL